MKTIDLNFFCSEIIRDFTLSVTHVHLSSGTLYFTFNGSTYCSDCLSLSVRIYDDNIHYCALFDHTEFSNLEELIKK